MMRYPPRRLENREAFAAATLGRPLNNSAAGAGNSSANGWGSISKSIGSSAGERLLGFSILRR
jgi:hypothetical protein